MICRPFFATMIMVVCLLTVPPTAWAQWKKIENHAISLSATPHYREPDTLSLTVFLRMEHRVHPRVFLSWGLDGSTDFHGRYTGRVFIDPQVKFKTGRDELLALSNLVMADLRESSLSYRLYAYWQSKHVRLGLGNRFAYFWKTPEPSPWLLFSPSYEIAVAIRPVTKDWNIEFALRNFDDLSFDGDQFARLAVRYYLTFSKSWRFFTEASYRAQWEFKSFARPVDISLKAGMTWRF